MGLAYTQDSAYAKEMVKWEAQHSQLGAPGRPYVYHEFPQRMYKASRPIGGGPVSFDGLTAGDEDERRNLLSRGYRVGQDKALAELESNESAIAEGAANRVYGERGMSDKAKREADAADLATAAHLPSIPEKPRTRKPRAKKSEVPDGV